MRALGAGTLGMGLLLAAATPAGPGDLARWFDGDRDRDRLPDALREASGLAVDDEGRLWSHDDERGVVWRLAEGSGDPAERRVLGPDPVRGDFEGLAWDGRRFHLVTSTGTLVSFEPGLREEVHDWSARRTGAEDVCEVEGLEVAPDGGGLVLACKTVYDRRWKGRLLLLEVPMPGDHDGLQHPPLPVRPLLAVPRAVLEAAGVSRALSPSGLTRAADGGWLILAGRQGRVVHVSDAGRVVDHSALPSGHPQAEGIALERPDLLTLVDEGDGGRGRVTRYLRPSRSTGSELP